MRRFARWSLALLGLAAAYAAVSVAVGRWALTTRANCELPCQDLGLDVETPPGKGHGTTVYRPRCAPLRLDLELYRPKARRNTRYALWHRLTMKNISCYRLSGLDAKDLVSTWESYEIAHWKPGTGGLSFRVWGPDGKEVPTGKFDTPGRPVYRYSEDPKALKSMERLYKMETFWGFALESNESIATIPSILHPMTLVPASDMTQPLAAVDGMAFATFPTPKDAEIPPAGFKILDSFVFNNPGAYKIQAVFDAKIDAEAILPYLKRVPDWLAWPMDALKRCGLDFYPDLNPIFRNSYHVHVESKQSEFKVEP